MVNISINKDGSSFRILEDFEFKLSRSLILLQKRDNVVMPKELIDDLNNDLNKLRKLSKRIQKNEYNFKGYFATSTQDYRGEHLQERSQKHALRLYKRQVLEAGKLIDDIHSKHRDFVILIETDPVIRSKVLAEKRVSYKLVEQDLLAIKKEYQSSIKGIKNLQIVKDNDSSFENIIRHCYENGKTAKEFFFELKSRWNLKTNVEVAEVLGVDVEVMRAFVRSGDRFSKDVARAVSKRFAGSPDNEMVVITLSGDNSLGTNKQILNRYSEKIGKADDIKEKQRLGGELLGQLYKRNGVPRTAVAENSIGGEFIDKTELAAFINRGEVFSYKRMQRLPNTVPYLSGEDKKTLHHLLFGKNVVRSADELFMDRKVGRGEMFKILTEQSLKSPKEYAIDLGISIHTLESIMDGNNIRANIAAKIRGKIGLSEGFAKDFIVRMVEKISITVNQQVSYFDDLFKKENFTLTEIREALGLKVSDISKVVGLGWNSIAKYEKNNFFPDNKIEAAFEAYKVPQKYHDEFVSRFSQNGRKVVDHWREKYKELDKTRALQV